MVLFISSDLFLWLPHGKFYRYRGYVRPFSAAVLLGAGTPAGTESWWKSVLTFLNVCNIINIRGNHLVHINTVKPSQLMEVT